jgi:hypothetical protein
MGCDARDMLSVLLCSTAVGFIWNKNGMSEFFIANILALLALLLKPTSVIVFEFLLLKLFKPHPFKKERPFRFLSNIFSQFFIFLPALFLADFYSLVVNNIIAHRGSPGLFAVSPCNPVQSFLEILNYGAEFYNVMDYHVFFPYGLSLFLIMLLFMTREKEVLPILCAFCLGIIQCFAIILLDEKHSLIHFLL